MPDPGICERVRGASLEDEQISKFIKYFTRVLAREVFSENVDGGQYVYRKLENVYLSVCYSCDAYAIWLADELIYPTNPTVIEPNEDMPPDVKLDFAEASAIVDKSPRGAAALLRLGIEKLMPHVGATKKKIDDNIGELVSRGLDPRIQQALDVVRVIGNHAVHPGQIDLQDDKATAMKLFGLVNLIVEAMISTPKHIAAMYDALPEGALAAIERRDSK